MRSLRLAPLVLLLLGLPAVASAADYVYATGTVAATRWLETDTAEVGVTKPGQRMEVLFTEGDRLRVRLSGSSFGWLNRGDVGDTDPNAGEGAEGFDLPELKLGADGKLELPANLQLGGGGLKLDLGE
mgnify:CR=1 FL=1